MLRGALYAAAVSPLVGRDEELDTLLRAWQQAKSEVGRLVLLSGEPGIGRRSAPARRPRRAVALIPRDLQVFCSPLHQDSTRSIRSWRAGSRRRDSHVVLPPNASQAGGHRLAGRPTAEDVALIAAMLSLPTKKDRYTANSIRGARSGRSACCSVDWTKSRSIVLMLFEDAQWADPFTRKLLDMLTDRLTELPILLVVSFRPRICRSLDWPRRCQPDCAGELAEPEGIRSCWPRRCPRTARISHQLLDRIVTQTDGVPLFIEELTKAVVETSADPNAAELPLTVPGTLQASLMARLDRLPAAKQVAQIGAVIGREFPHALLAAAAALLSDGAAHCKGSTS